MLMRWDPFTEMVSLRDAVGRLLNDSVVRPGAQWAGGMTAFPFDLYETPDQIVLRAAVPGADPSSIELTVNQGVLTLKGYRRFYTGDQEKQFTWHARGLVEGPFQFSAALPTTVASENADATFDAGILTVTLPKAESVKPRRIAIRSAQQQEALAAGAH